MSDLPDAQPGSVWQHLKSGGVYEIVSTAIWEPSMQMAIVYEALASGTIFARPASIFLDGRFKPHHEAK